MLRDIPNTALKIKILSATCQCYLPLHSHSSYVICHTCVGREFHLLNDNNPCFKWIKIHLFTCLQNFRVFCFLECPKSTSITLTGADSWTIQAIKMGFNWIYVHYLWHHLLSVISTWCYSSSGTFSGMREARKKLTFWEVWLCFSWISCRKQGP